MSTVFYWTRAANGFYSNASDWDQDMAPTNGDDSVYLPTLSKGYTVISSATEFVGYFEVDRGATLSIASDDFIVDPTHGSSSNVTNFGAINIGPGATFMLGATTSAELSGSGRVTLTGGPDKLATFSAQANWTGLFGGGVIALNGSAQVIGDATQASTLENKGDRIIGFGQIGNGVDVAAADDGLFLINGPLGDILATGGAGNALILNTGGNIIANSGLIASIGLGGLEIESRVLQDGHLVAAGHGALTIGDDAMINGTGAVNVLSGGWLSLANGQIATEGALYVGAGGAPGGIVTTTTGDTAGVAANGDFAGSVIQTDIFNYGLIKIVNDSTLSINANITQSNAGRIYLAGGAAATKLELFGGGASLWGGGLAMSDSLENAIVSNGVAEQFLNMASITGAGTIGDGFLRLINGPKGVVDANQTAGLTILGDQLGGLTPNQNNGLMEASAAPIGDGVLKIEGEFANAGTLLAAANGQVVLDGAAVDAGGGLVASVRNGELILENGSVISGQALIFNGVAGEILTSGAGAETMESRLANYGYVDIVAGSTLIASNAWMNQSLISFGSSTPLSGGAVLAVAAGSRLDLTGSGQLHLANAADSVVAAGAGALLTNQSETIIGAGTFGDVNLAIVNALGGVIDATGVMTLGDADVKAPAIVNSGVIEASNGAKLTVAGELQNTGSLIAQSGGSIFVQQSVQDAGLAIIQGTGVIEFAGEVNNEMVFAKGANGELILDAPNANNGDIWGFTSADTIDLANFKYVAGSTSVDSPLSGFGAVTGTLVLTNGSSTSQGIYFEGNYQNGTFQLASDHSNGTLVTWVPNKIG